MRVSLEEKLIAWGAVLVVLIVFALIASGVIGLPFFHGGFDYIGARERLADSDKSQALRMEGQYPGPLQDTTIQRWRDPVDGTICYIYLPIAVAHAPGPPGLVQYGSANIGSISCIRR